MIYYYVFLTIIAYRGVQLNLIAEGNIGALEVDRLILAVDLDRMVKRSFNLPYQTLSGFSTKRSNPGGRVNTKSSRLYPWYCLPANGQH